MRGAPHNGFSWLIVRSQNLIHERNLAVEAFLASLEFMAGWIARWISALRARFRRRGELILELIILRHQLAVLQRTGTRRPNFRVLGFAVALVGGLAAGFDDRPARNGVALAPSGLAVHLDIRLPGPLARWTPTDRS